MATMRSTRTLHPSNNISAPVGQGRYRWASRPPTFHPITARICLAHVATHSTSYYKAYYNFRCQFPETARHPVHGKTKSTTMMMMMVQHRHCSSEDECQGRRQWPGSQWHKPCVLRRREDHEGVRRVGTAVAMTALRYEGNSVRYGDISGLVDQSEVHVDVQVCGPSMLVFSGGTAFNGVVEELKKLTTRVAHVLPVSDDGGSTAEIVRVLGGPAVGDIRSRCLRLSSDSSMEALAVKRLLGHRLSQEEPEAKSEWYEIVEGEHPLWDDVSGPYRETIRAFLVHFQCQILRHSADKFSFRNGSIGNFFFAGARIFFQSLDAAIFLYSRVSHIPTHSSVLPAICTNDRLTLGCELMDGTVIKGQNAISHPTVKESKCRTSVTKASSPLPSPIKRIFYMSSEGSNIFHEVFPAVNPTVVEQLCVVDAVVYGMGSLFTSICPSLVLRGVGESIAARSCLKVLILNGTHDRETAGMSASAYVSSVIDALNRKFCDCIESHCDDPYPSLDHLPSDYITVMLVPDGGAIEVDVENLSQMGIVRVVTVESIIDEKLGRIFEPKALIEALQVEIALHHLHGSQ